MHGSGIYGWVHDHLGESIRHVLLYASLVVTCGLVVGVGRWSRTRGVGVARQVDRAWAGVLLGVWAVMVASYLRPARFGWDTSLPLHICQLVILSALIGLLHPGRLPRTIVYFWGLGLSSQTFIYVKSMGGLTHFDTYIGWGYHEANVAAVAYEVLVRRYRPTWRDWRVNAGCIGLYAVLVGSIDAALGADYGLIGRQTLYAPITAFGPWPARVVWLALTSAALTAVLALAWPRNWPARSPARATPLTVPV